MTVPVINSNSSSAEENAMVADYFTRIERKTVAFNPVTKAKLKAKLASRRKSGPMPWADIIITLVEYKLAGMPTKDSFSGSESAVMVVSYFTESLGQFELPKDWLRQRKGVNQPCLAAPRAKSVNKKPSLTDIVAEERQKSLEFEARLKSALKRATIGDENDDTDIPPAMNRYGHEFNFCSTQFFLVRSHEKVYKGGHVFFCSMHLLDVKRDCEI